MRDLLRTCIKGGALTFLFLAIPFLILLELKLFNECVFEEGLLENYQVLLLFLANIFLWRIVILNKEDRNFNILIAGFFTAVFIRELDWFLDIFGDELWEILSITVAVICIGISFVYRKGFFKSLNNFISSNYYNLFTVGLIVILFFSRLIGTKHLWLQILDYENVKLVKNIVQESLETFGYVIIFFASFFWYKDCKKKL